MPSESPDNDRNEPVGSTVAEETVRIETVRYLEGASGHAVLSLVVVLVAGVLLYQNRRGVAVVVLLVAYGVSVSYNSSQQISFTSSILNETNN
jgi:hypothetical protein